MDDLISRQAAIDAIKNNIMPTKEGFYEPSDVFCELTQLPSAQPEGAKDINVPINYIEPEPCEDAVSREAAIKCCTFGRTSLGLIGELRRLPSVTPKQRWILCVDGNEPKTNADCWISTNAKYVRRASYAPKANNQPNGFIVTEGGFGFYEYGKYAKAWMPYDKPEPYREEGEAE